MNFFLDEANEDILNAKLLIMEVGASSGRLLSPAQSGLFGIMRIFTSEQWISLLNSCAFLFQTMRSIRCCEETFRPQIRFDWEFDRILTALDSCLHHSVCHSQHSWMIICLWRMPPSMVIRICSRFLYTLHASLLITQYYICCNSLDFVVHYWCTHAGLEFNSIFVDWLVAHNLGGLTFLW